MSVLTNAPVSLAREVALPRSSKLEPSFDESAFTWCKEFQRLTESINRFHESSGPNEDCSSLYDELASLAQDFTFAARQYGRVIIMEKSLPDHLKTISPTGLPGVAGGAKYVVNGILFKFANDDHGFYGGIDNAQKASNLDLLGCAAVFGAHVPDIHLPLLALIDFRGHRLTAMSLLPIHPRRTLMVGSSDGGQHVAGDARALSRLAPLAKALHLKQHLIGGHQLWGPFDLEVHQSAQDDRLYLVDFARLLPPEAVEALYPSESPSRSSSAASSPSSSSSSPTIEQHSFGSSRKSKPAKFSSSDHGNPALYRMLRPELVRSHPIPLSPDAFSPLSTTDPAAALHRREVYEATQRLYRFVIPEYADWLVHQHEVDPSAYPFEFLPNHSMHAHGINMRHLFRVVLAILALHGPKLLQPQERMSSPSGSAAASPLRLEDPSAASVWASSSAVTRWLQVLMLEMVARTIKIEVRQAMRALSEQAVQQAGGSTVRGSEDAFRALVVRFLNKYLAFTRITGRESWAQNSRARLQQSQGVRVWSELSRALQKKFDFAITHHSTGGKKNPPASSSSSGPKHQQQSSVDVKQDIDEVKAMEPNFSQPLQSKPSSLTIPLRSNSKRFMPRAFSPAFDLLPAAFFASSSSSIKNTPVADSSVGLDDSASSAAPSAVEETSSTLSRSSITGTATLTLTQLREWVAMLFDGATLYQYVDRRRLFIRLQQMLNVIFRTEVWRERSGTDIWSFGSSTPLDASDVVDISDIVSDMNIFSFARAKTLHLQALSMPLETQPSALPDPEHAPRRLCVVADQCSIQEHYAATQISSSSVVNPDVLDSTSFASSTGTTSTLLPTPTFVGLLPVKFGLLCPAAADLFALMMVNRKSLASCISENVSPMNRSSSVLADQAIKRSSSSALDLSNENACAHDVESLIISSNFNVQRAKKRLQMAVAAFEDALASSSAIWIHRHMAEAYLDLARLELKHDAFVDALSSALRALRQLPIRGGVELPSHFSSTSQSQLCHQDEPEWQRTASQPLPSFFRKYGSYSVETFHSSSSESERNAPPHQQPQLQITPPILSGSAASAAAYISFNAYDMPSPLVSPTGLSVAPIQVDTLIQPAPSDASLSVGISTSDQPKPSQISSSITWTQLLRHQPAITGIILSSLLANMSSWQLHLSEASRVNSIDFVDSPPLLLCGLANGEIFIFDRITFQLLKKVSSHRGWIRAVRLWNQQRVDSSTTSSFSSSFLVSSFDQFDWIVSCGDSDAAVCVFDIQTNKEILKFDVRNSSPPYAASALPAASPATESLAPSSVSSTSASLPVASGEYHDEMSEEVCEPASPPHLSHQVSTQSNSSGFGSSGSVDSDLPQKVLCLDVFMEYLVIGSLNGNIYVYQIEHHSAIEPSISSLCVHILVGHFHSVYAVRLFRHPEFHSICLASGSSDSTIRIWDVAAGVCTAVIGEPQMMTVGVTLGIRRNIEIFSGHPLQLFVDQSKASEFLCAYCKNVAVDALSLSSSSCRCPSEVIVCKLCFQGTKHYNRCPSCSRNVEPSSFRSNSVMQKAISELEVRCLRNHLMPDTSSLTPSSDHDPRCGWKGALQDFPSHVALTEKPIHYAGGHSGWVQSIVVIAPWYLASGSFDNTIRLFELRTFELLHVFKGHTDGIWSLTSICLPSLRLSPPNFNETNLERDSLHIVEWMDLPPQILLVSGSTDSTIRVWSVDSRCCLRVLTAHAADVYALRARVFVDLETASADLFFTSHIDSEDHRKGSMVIEIAAGSADRSVTVWRFEVPDLISINLNESNNSAFPAFHSFYQSSLKVSSTSSTQNIFSSACQSFSLFRSLNSQLPFLRENEI